MKINNNNFWSETLISELIKMGVKNACISPGSRNTPITMALAKSEEIKKYVIVDERISGFFALGLAKSSGAPVIVECTSGTAAAELYPAIIEAYYSRTPLIVLTADRPPHLINCGANQTINQPNIYGNHIKLSLDAGIPQIIAKGMKKIFEMTDSIRAVLQKDRGPIHINLPFDEPLEPNNFTGELSANMKTTIAKMASGAQSTEDAEKKYPYKETEEYTGLVNLITKSERGLIIAGPEESNKNDYREKILELADKINAPILADVSSSLRFYKLQSKNVIANSDSLLRSDNLNWAIKPDYILQLGRTVTSKSILKYLTQCRSPRFIINEFGDKYDPSKNASGYIKAVPAEFIEGLISEIDKGELVPETSTNKSKKWLDFFVYADSRIEETKKEVISATRFPIESRIVNEVINLAPPGSNIFLSNSTPIRDFDYFASKTNKDYQVFFNRGASGIDGIISTALGVASANPKPLTVVIGDQALQHDISSLAMANNLGLSITIVLINNNGGGIFYDLPISEYGEDFKKYFLLPQNINFTEIVKGFSGYYKLMPSWQQFKREYGASFERTGVNVLEFRTDAEESQKIRKAYWERIDNSLSTDIFKRLNK
ncbi:MAG: 2-succinyl-5-enolpyruvyl-6-hydroxy-3-cyclohexene-1-carboxylic-acid synthase [Ignavibacteriaceae bacterium]